MSSAAEVFRSKLKIWAKLLPRQELIIAGWSTSRDRAEAYRIDSSTFTLGRIEKSVISPAEDAECEQLRARLARHGIDLNYPDPMPDGFLLLQEQRAIRDRGRTWLGGFCQLTTVTRFQITTQILGRWPDKIGERIVP